MNGKKSVILRSFYDQPCLDLSRALLGKVLCRQTAEDIVLRGRIVETEAYPGAADPASHSFNAKKTKRNGAMFMEPGTSYVYSIYGMYYCFNISSQGKFTHPRPTVSVGSRPTLPPFPLAESGGAVLTRSLEPLCSAGSKEYAEMSRNRRKRSKKTDKSMKITDLCSGPSKLCQALDINKDNLNEVDLTRSEDIWLEDAPSTDGGSIFVSTRIGIDGAGKESAEKPFRFYEKDNIHVSVLDKQDDFKKRKRNLSRSK